MDLAELNTLDRSEAAAVFAACCDARAWVDRMVAARPFHDATKMLTAAGEVWWDLSADDWEEAFAAHRDGPTTPAFVEYERRFGHPYVVFAADLAAEESDAVYRRRLSNDPLSELSVTATEQARITNRALRRLLGLF